MAINRTTPGVAYGLSDALLEVFPQPIVSTRDPQTGDKAQLGTIWVNKSTNDFFVLTSVVANIATWSAPSDGSGIFTSLEATTGNITADQGDIVATLGNVTAGAAITAGTDITATAGNITASAGNIVATLGSVSASTTVTAGTDIVAIAGDINALVGDFNATMGDFHATAGDFVADAGDVTVTAGNITAVAGDIEATAGAVIGTQFEVTGDLGGVAATTALTNVVDTTQGAGTMTILSANGNNGNNAGFLKIYVGTTTAYVPYFTDITP